MAQISVIQFFRGEAADIPTLADGEPGWCVDTFQLFVGQDGTNRLVGGVADNAVTNAKLADMDPWTFKIRNAGSSGDPSDAALANFTEAVPADGDFLIGFLSSGEIRKFSVEELKGNGGLFFFLSNGGIALGGSSEVSYETTITDTGGIALGGGFDVEIFDTPGDDTVTFAVDTLALVRCWGSGQNGTGNAGDGGRGGDFWEVLQVFPAGTYDVHVPDADDGHSGSRDAASGAWFSDGDPDDYVWAGNGDTTAPPSGVGDSGFAGGAGGSPDGDAGGGGGSSAGPEANGNAGGNASDPTPGTGGANPLGGGAGGDGGGDTQNGADGEGPGAGGGGGGTGGAGGTGQPGRVEVIRLGA